MATQALAAISKTCQLVGKPSPVYKLEGEYILPIKKLIEGIRSQEPPFIPKMAVPLDVPEAALHLAYLTSNTREKSVVDLITVEF